MTPEELDILFEKLRNGITMTDAELKKLQESLGGWKAFTAVAQSELKKGAAGSGKAMGRFVSDVDSGSKGFSQLNPIIDSVAGAMGEMAKAIPYAGNVLAGTFKLLAEGSKFTLTQIDKTAVAFNDLGKVGALTAKGMSGIQEQFLATGLTLDGFKKNVIENANAMAAFRGTTAEGAKDFSKVVGSLLDKRGEFNKLGTELKKIGMTPDMIGDAAADFVKVQAQLGAAQQKDYKQLALGTAEYAKEMDEVTRLTGMTRKEQQAARDDAMRDARYRATISKMMSSGDEQQIKQARELEKAHSALTKEAPELAKALRSDITGMAGVTTDAAGAFNATGGASFDLAQKLKEGSINVVEFMNQYSGAIKQNMTQLENSAQTAGDIAGVYTSFYQLANISNKKWVESEGKLVAEQKGAINTQDKLTTETLTAQEQLQEMNRRMTNFAFVAMPHASKAVNQFTSTLNAFLKKVGSATGAELPTLEGGDEETEKKAETAKVVKTASMWTMAIGGIITALGAAASATGIGAAAGIPMMTAGAGLMGAGAAGSIVGDATGFAEGGISTGPNSGHMELLHGTEAVVPLSGGRSIPVSLKGGGSQSGAPVGMQQQFTQFLALLPQTNKSMLGFTEALNRFVDVSQGAANKDKETPESWIDKTIGKTIDFVQNIVKGLFGEDMGGAGGAGRTRAAPGAAGPTTATPGGPRGPVTSSLYEQTQEAINKGVRYGFGSKDVASGKIDCSGWVASINQNMMESINKEAGKEVYSKEAKKAMQGSAADIIKNVSAATGVMMTGDEVNADNLKEGMTIGMDTGDRGWDRGRFEGIDHIVQVIKDAEGKLKVSESTGDERSGGVKMTDLNEWLANSKKMGAKMFATDPTRMAEGAGTGFTTGPGGAAFGGPRRGASAPTDMSTYMKTVAMLESGGDVNAKAKTSSAGGLFGFLKSSYEDVTGRRGQGEERFDPAKATEAMQKLTTTNKTQMEKGLGRQVSGEDLYMGHFLGAGGATKFLKQKEQTPQASAAEMMPTEAAANKSIFYKDKEATQSRTLAEVQELMASKYRKQQEFVTSGATLPAAVAALGTGGPQLIGAGVPGTPTSTTTGNVPQQQQQPQAVAQARPRFAQPTNPIDAITAPIFSLLGGGGLGGVLGGGASGVAAPSAPVAGSAASPAADISTVVQAVQASNESTQTSIRSSMTDMTSQLREIISQNNSGAAPGSSSEVASLLQQILDSQRDQTSLMNRLLQNQTA